MTWWIQYIIKAYRQSYSLCGLLTSISTSALRTRVLESLKCILYAIFWVFLLYYDVVFSCLTIIGSLNCFPWKINCETIGFAHTGGLECDSCTMGKCLCELWLNAKWAGGCSREQLVQTLTDTADTFTLY